MKFHTKISKKKKKKKEIKDVKILDSKSGGDFHVIRLSQPFAAVSDWISPPKQLRSILSHLVPQNVVSLGFSLLLAGHHLCRRCVIPLALFS